MDEHDNDYSGYDSSESSDSSESFHSGDSDFSNSDSEIIHGESYFSISENYDYSDIKYTNFVDRQNVDYDRNFNDVKTSKSQTEKIASNNENNSANEQIFNDAKTLISSSASIYSGSLVIAELFALSTSSATLATGISVIGLGLGVPFAMIAVGAGAYGFYHVFFSNNKVQSRKTLESFRSVSDGRQIALSIGFNTVGLKNTKATTYSSIINSSMTLMFKPKSITDKDFSKGEFLLDIYERNEADQTLQDELLGLDTTNGREH